MNRAHNPCVVWRLIECILSVLPVLRADLAGTREVPVLGGVLPPPPTPKHSEPGWHMVTLIKRCSLTDLQLEKLGGGASGKADNPPGEEN